MPTKKLIKQVAKQEQVSPAYLEKKIAQGRAVILKNKNKELKKIPAVGEGLKIKVNTNIGTSSDKRTLSDELAKLETAIEFGSDAIMDLSTGGNIRKTLQKIIKHSTVPVGTVPLYQAAKNAIDRRGDLSKMKVEDILEVVEQQAKDGVDFFTIHAGILKKTVDYLKQEKRVGGIVSRGGAIIANWVNYHNKENPLYEYFHQIIKIAKKYDITISLGDALRPGSIADSTDSAQLSELFVLGELVKKCNKQGVQVMVEGPGHIKLDEIEANVVLEKKICNRVPFYILGPLPTDIACGYDHITASIGGAIAAKAGANFLCVVTPAEHLRQPSIDDIRQGVVAAKIAAHSVDLLRFEDESDKDYKLSVHRGRRRWKDIYKLALDPKKAQEYHQSSKRSSEDICTMCGKFCSLKITESCDLLK
jgi:phosphomethylpyrimidine synthase